MRFIEKHTKGFVKKTALLLLSSIFCLNLVGQEVNRENHKQDAGEDLSDSINKNKEVNKVKVTNLLFTGTLLKNQEKKQKWYIPTFFDLLPPNTVEGFVFNPSISFTQYTKKEKFINLKPNLRYGFGNEKLSLRLSSLFYYAPRLKASIRISGGSFIEQFNGESTLNALNNTFYTFLRKENFLKIYQRDYVELNHIIAPLKDFLLTTELSWNKRSSLRNLSKYSEENSTFTSNLPVNNELFSTDFARHKAVLWEAQLRWQFGHSYTRERGKFKAFSFYPAVTLYYSGAAANLLGSDISFQKIALRVTETFNAMVWGTGQFFFEVGDFLTKEEITFIDFNHFNGKRTVYGNFAVENFQLLDYYRYSTTDFYIQGHYEHQWNGLTNKPKSSLIKPVIAFHYLYTPAEGSYLEAGLGLNKILNRWRVDFYTSWKGKKQESIGLRLGIVIE